MFLPTVFILNFLSVMFLRTLFTHIHFKRDVHTDIVNAYSLKRGVFMYNFYDCYFTCNVLTDIVHVYTFYVWCPYGKRDVLTDSFYACYLKAWCPYRHSSRLYFLSVMSFRTVFTFVFLSVMSLRTLCTIIIVKRDVLTDNFYSHFF